MRRMFRPSARIVAPFRRTMGIPSIRRWSLDVIDHDHLHWTALFFAGSPREDLHTLLNTSIVG
jgi:hypothetical protein